MCFKVCRSITPLVVAGAGFLIVPNMLLIVKIKILIRFSSAGHSWDVTVAVTCWWLQVKGAAANHFNFKSVRF